MSETIRIQPAIMSGGAGTRLWPMSRMARPKQFAALASDLTLLQETARRVQPADGFLPPLVIAGAGHARLVAEQLAAIGIEPAAIIVEPEGRNTAAVAAVAAGWSHENAKEALVLLLPADHHVANEAGFRKAIAAAAPIAVAGRIVTFGVKPTRPHTGFGYIEQGARIAPGVSAIAAFREKPDAATASAYVSGGRHFWNAGVFLFDPKTMLDELVRCAPEIAKQAGAALAAAARKDGAFALDPAAFKLCPADSIDYAVMEKTDKAAVAGPLDVGWSDVGSWSAIEGGGDASAIIVIDTEGCIIRTEGPLVAAIGVEDLIIVATGDAVLVAPKHRAEEVKKIVETLKARGRTDLL